MVSRYSEKNPAAMTFLKSHKTGTGNISKKLVQFNQF